MKLFKHLGFLVFAVAALLPARTVGAAPGALSCPDFHSYVSYDTAEPICAQSGWEIWIDPPYCPSQECSMGSFCSEAEALCADLCFPDPMDDLCSYCPDQNFPEGNCTYECACGW